MLKKIVIKDVRKKYVDGEIQTNRIDNYPIWYNETHAKLNAKRLILSQDEFINMLNSEVHSLIEVRINEFKKLFGKQDFLFKTDYTLYAWTLEASNGCKVIVFSGKGRGTDCEIILNNNDPTNPSETKVNQLFYEYRDLMIYLYETKIEDVSLEGYEIYSSAKNYNL